MKRAVLAEEAHIVNILPPVDINGGAVESDYFSMKESAHASIILTLGVTGAASTVTLFESDDAAGTTETAIAFSVYKEETAAGDTLGARTAVAAAGFATSTENSITYVIEVDACDLTDGYPYLVLKLSDPEVATLVSAVAVLSGNRYAPAGTQIV
jgi:hypothetical protein